MAYMNFKQSVYLDGNLVDSDKIDAAKHEFIGMFRIPEMNPLTGADLLCPCTNILRCREDIFDHYRMGHFDTPQYVSMAPPSKSFTNRVKDMNRMYDLPVPVGVDLVEVFRKCRLSTFKEILSDELDEIHSIEISQGTLSVATQLADLLGDLIVYCWSEAIRHGIPIDEVLDIIMDSNESKLGADDSPIKDENDKFLKGPNYWDPAEKIRELLGEYRYRT